MNLFEQKSVRKKHTHHHILDLSQLVIATIVMEMQKDTPNMSADFIRHLILNTIRKNIFSQRFEYPEIIIAVDRKGNWRKKIAYYYKKSREDKRKNLPFDFNEIYTHLNNIIPEIRKNFPYYVIAIDGAEADDIIAVLTKYFTSKDEYVKITSGDCDFVQLQKYPNVVQWSPTLKKWIQSKDPAFDLLTKIVKGDTSDTIANIKSPSDYLLVREEGTRAPSITQKFLEALHNAKDPLTLLTDDEKARFLENKKLVDFDEIPLDIQEKIVLEYETMEIAPSRNILPYLNSHDMVRLINVMHEF